MQLKLGNGIYLSEDDVLAIEPCGGDSGDEELASVGVGSSVGHGKEERLVVLVLEVLISELLSVTGVVQRKQCEQQLNKLTDF